VPVFKHVAALMLPERLCDALYSLVSIPQQNKCIEDDTKVAAHQSPNCIKATK